MIRISPEFSSLIPPLMQEEYQQLESNVRAEGCRDPLVVWPCNGKLLLLDGHNRYRICQQYQIPFDIIKKDFPNHDKAVEWIINNQLGRRNLTSLQKSYLRGKRYNAEKKQGERIDLTSRQNGEKLNTRERLSDEYKVSPRTIERDGQFAESVDTIAANVGDQFKQQILSRDTPIPKKEILHISGLSPEEQRQKSIHFSSISSEWYTPPEIIQKILSVLEEIDLDPCSENKKNPNIPAHQHFTQEDNGLSHPWNGRIYMNPPYGREIIDWIDYLCSEYEAGRIVEALCLVPSRTDTEWFRKLRKYPRCFVWGRLRFSNFENSAPFPSMIVYLGENKEKFKQNFMDIGDIYISI